MTANQLHPSLKTSYIVSDSDTQHPPHGILPNMMGTCIDLYCNVHLVFNCLRCSVSSSHLALLLFPAVFSKIKSRRST